MNWIVWFLWLLCIFIKVQAEVYTAMAGMESLLQTEDALLVSLNAHIKQQEDQLKALKKTLKIYRSQYETAMKDVSSYLSNPINAFKIIKHITLDWPEVENVITKTAANFSSNVAELKSRLTFPTSEDLSGAAEALVRLQDLYHLATRDVAMGKLNGVQYSDPMKAEECFELGRQMYNINNHYHANQWMTESLHIYDNESSKTVSKEFILEHIAYNAFLSGNLSDAVAFSKQVLEINPNNTRVQNNIVSYEDTIRQTPDVKSKSFQPYIPESVYSELCREILELPERVKKNLKCRYFSDTHPFLKLAPFKLEEHYLDPYVVVFHDVMYDREMEYIKETAKPRFIRATVVDSNTGVSLKVIDRISKAAWIKDHESKIISTITQRVGDMTGLYMGSSEELQIANYGIGGHYAPHYDFSKKEDLNGFGSKSQQGNRIATVLFYMTDVAQGGNTVFPDIGLSVKPKKGTAVFWLNLFPSGEGNFATRHAACPVLQGEKWVSNKWIRQLGQELIQPCTLHYQEQGFDNKVYPKPVHKLLKTN